MTVAVGIVAHPARWSRALALEREVGAEVLALDGAGLGERANHQDCLKDLASTGADWLCMVEDDAIPCDGFRERLAAQLANVDPAIIISEYLGTGRWGGTVPAIQEKTVADLISGADLLGAEWITTNALWHAVAVAVPGAWADDLLAHLAADPAPTDEAVTHWCRREGAEVAYAWPSLVDHDDSLARVTAGRPTDPPAPRHAIRFAGRSTPWPTP